MAYCVKTQCNPQVWIHTHSHGFVPGVDTGPGQTWNIWDYMYQCSFLMQRDSSNPFSMLFMYFTSCFFIFYLESINPLHITPSSFLATNGSWNISMAILNASNQNLECATWRYFYRLFANYSHLGSPIPSISHWKDNCLSFCICALPAWQPNMSGSGFNIQMTLYFLVGGFFFYTMII